KPAVEVATPRTNRSSKNPPHAPAPGRLPPSVAVRSEACELHVACNGEIGLGIPEGRHCRSGVTAAEVGASRRTPQTRTGRGCTLFDSSHPFLTRQQRLTCGNSSVLK